MDVFTHVPGKDIGDIRVYALSTCGWCKKAKKFFEDRGIGYCYVNVDEISDEDSEVVFSEQRKFNPRGSFPTIVINNKDCIIGYDLDKLEKLAGE